MGPKLRRLEDRIRCLFRLHELVLDVVPAKPAEGDREAESARLRLRCLHCSHVTPGWEQGQPAYVRKHDGKDLSLPNPRLATVQAIPEPVPDPVQAQPARKKRTRRKPTVDLPIAAAGGGRRVVNFGLARQRRMR